MEKARTILASTVPPPRIANKPDSFACRFCRHVAVCQYTFTPEVNCRTCAFLTPAEGGKWECAKLGERTNQQQEEACSEYELMECLEPRRGL
jgi:hypothetical protein